MLAGSGVWVGGVSGSEVGIDGITEEGGEPPPDPPPPASAAPKAKAANALLPDFLLLDLAELVGVAGSVCEEASALPPLASAKRVAELSVVEP